MTISLKNKDGFTLVEFLVAMVIIAVGLMALLQSVNLSLAQNVQTMLRNQAVMLADERMTLEKAKSFDSILTTDNNPPQTGHYTFASTSLNVKGSSTDYSVTTIGTELTNNTKSIEIDVSWNHKGKTYTHSISSLVSKHQ